MAGSSDATFPRLALRAADCELRSTLFVKRNDIFADTILFSFAFVEYEDRRDAEDAYHEMHNKRLTRDDLLKIEVSSDHRQTEVRLFSITNMVHFQWARTPPSASWRFDSGRDRDRRPPRSPRRRSPSPRRARDYSPRKDDRRDRDRDYDRDRRDTRDRSRSPDRRCVARQLTLTLRPLV